ncbi:type III restriction-modification system endonuclease [Helicobacter mehlei]|uniref:Type III restriction-modification system endonuclease n=1 Tax=Helicobacter mehlei TaxID=2316080 RepID=A0A553V290_9HELI|nr:type III restriction-modification system endonuclease [Helicobacter mehlei]TSA86609.1 type III restriction-modification system endonuclease [Helicobacter mehlei]
MLDFNYENLEHQVKAVESVLRVFKDFSTCPSRGGANPKLVFDSKLFEKNLEAIHQQNNLDHTQYTHLDSNILDISMETGTGKTYTYTKLMLELHRHLQQSKFIVIVPSLAIKAGAVKFLKAEATRTHFRDLYQQELGVHVVSSTPKKDIFPPAIANFVKAPLNPNKIDILMINQGMLNAPSLDKAYDQCLFEHLDRPFEALKAVCPLIIIDEPHRFKKDQKSFKNIKKIEAPWVFRFGATFEGREENLIYRLSALEAFNQNLVKGVQVFTHGLGQHAAPVQLVGANGYEARFKQGDQSFSMGVGESLSKIHADLNLTLEKISKKSVLISNGLELKIHDSIHPARYHTSLREQMIDQALEEHFKLERKLLSRVDKIKPLLLFFIDDIAGYREGGFKESFNALVKHKLEKLLSDEETREDRNDFYVGYLKKSLADIESTHGGYFARDNFSSDEKIEAQIQEILHDKERLLDLENPRRFIFSQWTLKEGWDNPNVFGICKLRASGSETSKLQEVGRGLRLPVNEYGARIKEEAFYLNYFVDFSEKDFVAKLTSEINSGVGMLGDPKKLSEEMIESVCGGYSLGVVELLTTLEEAGIINRANEFKEGGFEKLKAMYPDVFNKLRAGKIKHAKDKPKLAHIRKDKYPQIKQLWEQLNQKAILQYVGDEEAFCVLLKDFLKAYKSHFKAPLMGTKKQILHVKSTGAHYQSEELSHQAPLQNSMPYGEFLMQLALETHAQVETLHKAFSDLQDELDINLYLNPTTIRLIKAGLTKYLLDHGLKGGGGFHITYQKIQHSPHPSAFTNMHGQVLEAIDPGNLGVQTETLSPAQNYLFEEVYYDSTLEKENILHGFEEVLVFSKIPKNSLKIPLSGGGTYSPDFAYVLKEGSSLVVEVKGKQERDLMADETQKIAHAKEFFKTLSGGTITFVLQDQQTTLRELITQIN